MPLDLTATYDGVTLVSQIRLKIMDIDVTTDPPATTPNRADWSCLFVDAEILGTASQYPVNTINLTAAALLDNIASNTALLAKKLRIGDYEEDTKGVAKELRDQANQLRHADDLTPASNITDVPWTDANWGRIAVRPQGG